MKTTYAQILPLGLLLVIGAMACDTPELEPCCEATPDNIWQPAPGTSFDWILTEDEAAILNSPAEVIDIDGFWATAQLVDSLHALGKKVIAYISVGTLEDWRPDVDDFPASIIGRRYGAWPDERWLDIRNLEVLGPMLEARMDMVAAKGFDAIEPDNLDAFEQSDTGFPIQDVHAHNFCVWLIEAAHQRGLSIGQKNVLTLAPSLVEGFDWALSEDAFYWEEIGLAQPFYAAQKAIFATEYTDLTDQGTFEQYCSEANGAGITVILKDRDLTSELMTCVE